MPPARLPLWTRFKASMRASFGEIVFGMEDGTVSIFGLVFGLAVTAKSADQVWLAGATGAIAASVSMAAGVFLDYQSKRDEVRVARARRRAEIAAEPARVQAEVLARLAHSAWMFVSDLMAGLTPVLPFAFLPLEQARVVSIALTVTLLVALGVARARIGVQPVLPTVLQTLAIASAAGGAGVAIAHLVG